MSFHCPNCNVELSVTRSVVNDSPNQPVYAVATQTNAANGLMCLGLRQGHRRRVRPPRPRQRARCGNCPHDPDIHSPVGNETCAVPGCPCPGLLTVTQ